MTSILKSDSNSKNGIILKELTKKFVEATSTSGCDSEMSEITSSIPNSLSLNTLNNENTTKSNDMKEFSDTKICELPETAKSSTSIEITYELEDIIDGFSIFSFATDEDLMKFSIKHEKIESLTEMDGNNKIKKFSRTKTKNKIFKNAKESTCNDECIDIYDFQANSESSPSSKHSSVIFKKSINKSHSTKHSKKSKYKFKNENNSSLSEENSSNTSVTESHNLSIVDGHNDSPQPTSNDDNNVVSTTTPDNLNIEIRKSDSLNNSGKSHSPALKTASLRLFKLEDELTMSGISRTEKNTNNNASSALSIGSVNEKISNSQLRLHCTDEKFQSKIVPTKFSVDLLTTVTDRQSVVTDESNLCLNNNNYNSNINNNLKNSPEIDIINSVQPVSTNIRANNLKSIDSNSVDIQSTETVKMSSVGVKQVTGINCRSSTPFRDSILDSNGLYNENRLTKANNSHYLPNDEESLTEKLINDKVMNAGLLASSYHKDVDASQNSITSWFNLQYNKSIYNNNATGQHSKTLLQANNTNYPMMPPKAANSYNALKNCANSNNNSNNHNGSSTNNNNNNNNNNNSNSIHSNNNSKLQHDSPIDWPNSYFDSAKMLPNSMQKFNPSIGSLSYDLTNNIRYQQEQQDLMNALRLKHENAKISKPLVQLGIDGMYKLDPTSFKNIDTRFQNHNSNTNNYFMPNTQMHIDFNSANVFKSRSDTRSRHNCTDPVTNKPLPVLSSSSTSNFKTPETAKKRGHWCDMHVKIAYLIYRSQKRLSKSQEINAQLPHLVYADKIPSATPTSSITQYPSTLLQHSNPYLDFRSSQMKNDSNFMNYQSKSSSAFPSSPIRPLNSYPYILPQNIDLDIQPITNPLDDHHQTAEQKWMRLLTQYMTNHPLSNLDRNNIDAMNQFYIWCQQFSQLSNPQVPHFNPSIPTSPLQTPNIDANSVYVRKYMEQLSSYLKGNEGNSYINNAMTEREMHILLMKQQQQQYQKAMLSKYQSTLNKSTNMSNHINPLINSVNSFYSKMKPINPDPIIPHYTDCNPSLINHKYRITHDHLRQMKYDQLAANHHLRNGYSKPPENINPKRRKLNPDSAKTFQVDLLTNEKESTKPSTDLSPENISNNCSNKNIASNNSNNNNINNTTTTTTNNSNNNNNSSNNSNVENRSSNSRENSNFQLQAVVSESRE